MENVEQIENKSNRERTKTFRAAFSKGHLQEVFPQVVEVINDPKELTAFLGRHFRGQADHFEVQIQAESISLEWKA